MKVIHFKLIKANYISNEKLKLGSNALTDEA